MLLENKKYCGNSKHGLFELSWHSVALGTVMTHVKSCSTIFSGSSSLSFFIVFILFNTKKCIVKVNILKIVSNFQILGTIF